MSPRIEGAPAPTIGENSGIGSAQATAKSRPAQTPPKSGNANAPCGQLPDIARNPGRARVPEIDEGLEKLNIGGIRTDDRATALKLEGESQVLAGIDLVVSRLVGENHRKDYVCAKPATDAILVAHSNRKNVAAVVNGVNEYLQVWVSDGLKVAKNNSQLAKAKGNAVKYVTDKTGPNSMDAGHRLKGLVDAMKRANVDPKIIDEVKAKCEQAITYEP